MIKENLLSVILSKIKYLTKSLQSMRCFASLNMTRKKIGFSLVELMISLIVISIVTAAFMPIITKKLKTSDTSIGSSSVDYTYDEEICSAKVSNCSVCINNECVKCVSGYYLDSNNKCISCSTGCANCKNGTTCNQCLSGYKLQGSSCVAITCPNHCSQCNFQTGECLNCADGYYLNNGTCSACHSYCATCTGSDVNQCTSCKPRYWKNGSTCVYCGDYCTACNPTSGCKACANGYYVNANGCSALSCQSYQYIEGNRCVNCDRNTPYFKCDSNGKLTGCVAPYNITHNDWAGKQMVCCDPSYFKSDACAREYAHRLMFTLIDANMDTDTSFMDFSSYWQDCGVAGKLSWHACKVAYGRSY